MDFSKVLEQYLPDSHTVQEKNTLPWAVEKETKFNRKIPQDYASLDLHGYTRDEAAKLLDRNLKDCLNNNISTLLIIHGKGLHSEDEGVLPEFIKEYLAAHPLAGKQSQAPRKLGGSGAVFVRVRLKQRRG